jgi:hypothetical protein
MKNILILSILVLSLLSSNQGKTEKIILKDISTIQTQQIPITITVRSIKDLRVKENQSIKTSLNENQF